MDAWHTAKLHAAGTTALAVSACALCAPLLAIADTSVPCTSAFTRTLSVGSVGPEVLQLQKILNSSADTMVAVTGDGSPGRETPRFGSLTRAAVIRFQEKYTSEILAPHDLAVGNGIVRSATRAKLNTLCVSPVAMALPATATSSAGSTPATSSMGTLKAPGMVQGAATGTVATAALILSAAEQPAASLAPSYALSIPFTHVTLSAQGADVTVHSVTIERIGPSQDQVVDTVDLLDTDGNFYDSGHLDSHHRTVIKSDITIAAGTSVTLIVAGSIADATDHNGELLGFSVVGIDADAPLQGEFPVRGTLHSINSTLTIGVPHVSLSPDDPNAARTLYISDTGITFSAIRITPDSREDEKLTSITWRQAGSAAPSDISDVHVIVNGTRYPTTVSERDYTADFGAGILVPKGRSLDLAIRGNLTTSGSNRTVQFDIHDGGDIGIEGLTYGFGIYPVPEANTDTVVSANHSIFATEDGTTDTDSVNPFFIGSTVTISPGAMVSIGR